MSRTTEEKLRDYRIAHESVAQDNERLEAEIARLQGVIKDQRAQLDKLGDRFDAQSDENARLRAALEEIADDPTGVSSYQADIAKAALAKED